MKLNNYKVVSENREENINANGVSWSAIGLVFRIDGEIVAVFIKWDYWIEVLDED